MPCQRGDELSNLVSVLGGHLIASSEGVPTGNPCWVNFAQLEWALEQSPERLRPPLRGELFEKVEVNGPAPLDKLRTAASVADHLGPGAMLLG